VKIPLSEESRDRMREDYTEWGPKAPIWVATCASCIEDIREGDDVRSMSEIFQSEPDFDADCRDNQLMHAECWADFVERDGGFIEGLTESMLNGTLKIDIDNGIHRIGGMVFRDVPTEPEEGKP